MKPDVKAEIQRLWEEHTLDSEDPCRRWNQSWSRVRSFCKELARKQNSENRIPQLQREVEDKRRVLERDCSEDAIHELMELEDELQNLEKQEASLWYLRSCSKWLRFEEAPTSYFFSLTKARFSRDRIACLKTNEGVSLTRWEDILKLIAEYFSEIYDAEAEGLENRLARQRILSLIDKRISIEDQVNMDRIPEGDEIDEVMKTLKRGKAPGLDGFCALLPATSQSLCMVANTIPISESEFSLLGS
ncbi:hypothetical protein R1sor_005709 [Riccia sorocarpa]|uniref:Uncharacterized protein n=1 Tax=Riccia sorocarpa TaxID=122646 RepID=A0ABD3HKA4_9MARC